MKRSAVVVASLLLLQRHFGAPRSCRAQVEAEGRAAVEAQGERPGLEGGLGAAERWEEQGLGQGLQGRLGQGLQARRVPGMAVSRDVSGAF